MKITEAMVNAECGSDSNLHPNNKGVKRLLNGLVENQLELERQIAALRDREAILRRELRNKVSVSRPF